LEGAKKRHKWGDLFLPAKGLEGVRPALGQSRSLVCAPVRLTFCSDMVWTQMVKIVPTIQLLFPEGNVIQFLLLKTFLLLSHKISILERNIGKRGWLPGFKSAIDQGKFPKQNSHGPIIGDEVMSGQQKKVIFRIDTQQFGT